MIRYFISSLLIFFMSVGNALACPCGCGSSDFLSLNPIETFKYRLLISKEFSPTYYDGKSNPNKNSTKIRAIDTYEIATVFSPYRGLALSAQLPFKKNIGVSDSYFSVADPSLHFLVSVLEKDAYDTFHISLKSGLSAKFPFSNASAEQDELYVTSNGHWELSPNFSSTFTYQEWTFSLKETITVRFAEKDIYTHPVINRIGLGFGYTLFGYGQAMVNLNQELRFNKEAPVEVNRFTHDLRWSLGARVGEGMNLSFHFKHPILFQKSAPFYQEFGIGFTQAF